MGLPLRFWLLTGTITLGSVGALAADTKTPYPSCTTTPTEADRKAAQGAFAAGQGSFNEADYATAITYWRDAYRRDCTAHPLLLNLARAYELKGDRAEAVNALETYLARKPDDPTADQIKRRIENLKSQVAPAATATPTPTPAPTPAAQPAAMGTTATAPLSAEPTPQAEAPSKGHKPIAPLIMAGGGGLLAIVGGVIWAGGQSKISDAENTCPNRNCPNLPPSDPKYAAVQAAKDEGNKGKSQSDLGGALFIVGLGVAAGGVIWYAVAKPQAPTAMNLPAIGKTDVVPVLGRGFAGVSLSGSF